MTDIIHRLPEVKKITGLSRTKIYELIKAGQFPKQIPISLRSVGWSENEIEAWQKKQKAKRT